MYPPWWNVCLNLLTGYGHRLYWTILKQTLGIASRSVSVSLSMLTVTLFPQLPVSRTYMVRMRIWIRFIDETGWYLAASSLNICGLRHWLVHLVVSCIFLGLHHSCVGSLFLFPWFCINSGKLIRKLGRGWPIITSLFVTVASVSTFNHDVTRILSETCLFGYSKVEKKKKSLLLCLF